MSRKQHLIFEGKYAIYLNYEVDIPRIPGKINYVKKEGTVYVRYVLERVYYPEKKYNVPEQRIIGKRSENNPDRMLPNETFVKYFCGQEMLEQKAGQTRSSCRRIGTFLVIQKILNGYKLPEILEKYLGKKYTDIRRSQNHIGVRHQCGQPSVNLRQVPAQVND